MPAHLACLRPVLCEDVLWHMWVCEIASRFARGIARRRAAAVVIQRFVDAIPDLVPVHVPWPWLVGPANANAWVHFHGLIWMVDDMEEVD